MTATSKHFSIWAAFMVASLATAFAAAGASQAGSGALRCEIAAEVSGGATRIAGLAYADKALSGSYRLRVSGPGASIDQNGEFDAAAGGSAMLGQVMLGGDARSYDVRLEVKAAGHTASCVERITRSI